MKNIVTTILIFLSIKLVLPIHAQNISLGVVGGLNIADMKLIDEFDAEEETKTINCLSIGGIFSLALNEHIYLSVEPMYIQKGATLVQSASSEPSIDINVDFIELPLLFKFYYSRNYPYLFFGPSFAYTINSEAQGEIGGILFKADLKALTEKIGVNVVAGIGVKFDIDMFSLFLEGRYNYGLSDLMNGGTTAFRAGSLEIPLELQDDDDAFTRDWQLLLGVSLPLTK